MRFPVKLSFYIARSFFQTFVMVFLMVAAVIILGDVVDMIRRSYSAELPFSVIMRMVLYKFPIEIQKLFGFVILIAAMLSLVKLTRTNELIIARSSGISVWQFLRPVVVTSFLIGIFVITVYNPLACALMTKYDKLLTKHVHGRTNLMEVSPTGIWLRQHNYPLVKDKPGETIIHALRAAKENLELYEVVFFVFAQEDKFSYRIDARTALLENGYWHMHDAILTFPDKPGELHPDYLLATDLTRAEIQDSFASPESISFWALPGFISALKNAGFSAIKHRMYWFQMLVIPFLLSAMVFIAASFSLRQPRQGRIPLLISISVCVGFSIYFFSDLISALAMAGNIPIPLAAFAPTGVCLLLGVSFLMHTEDG